MTKQFRDTKQRFAIKRAIAEANRPVGPKEILALASKEVPNLGIATVYRNIKTMVEQKELDAVNLPGQADRYQLPGQQSKHLFICEKTDSVFNLDLNLEDLKIELPQDFKLKSFQVVCFGEITGKKKTKITAALK
jgi:Fur family ferric uptake transcriptional regulator